MNLLTNLLAVFAVLVAIAATALIAKEMTQAAEALLIVAPAPK